MNGKNIEEILKKVAAEDIPADVHKIAQQVSADFSRTLLQTKKQHIFWEHIIWEYIMRSPIAKLAVAAAVFIACLIGISFWRKSGSGIALADVLAKVEQVQACMYKMRMTTTVSMIPDMPAVEQQMEATVIISAEYGMKMIFEVSDPNGKKITTESYVLPESKQMISILPEMKKYMQMQLDDDLFAKTRRENNDPRYIIKQIMSSTYKELGRSEIDGLEVEGFEAADLPLFGGSGSKVTLWVDAENWLPVRMEMDLKGEHMQATGVIYGYQWDMAVQPEEFQPVIPSDFEPMATGMLIPKISEEGLIEGLRLFAELSGSYPKKLSMMELAQETMAFVTNRDVLEKIVEKIPEFRGLDEDELDKLDGHEVMMKTMQVTKPLQSLGLFYMVLVQDKKEPVYYGESVMPADTDKVLLRWKTSDNEYRVIFGDLRAETVTAEKLAELEAGLPK